MKNTLPFKIDKKNNSLVLNINLLIYEKDAAMQAAYIFADKYDIFFDVPSKKKLEVILKAKGEFSEKSAEKIAGEFYNQILSATIRKKVSAGNKKLIESVLAGTIIASLENNDPDKKKFLEETLKKRTKRPLKTGVEKEIAELEKEIGKIEIKGGYKKDSLGIRKIRS